MTFLNPFLLLGAAAVCIPVVIHLLNRRKFDRVVWAAMRFLRTSVDQNQRRLRFEDLILLLLRCLLLVLLAAALARPAVRGATSGAFFGQQHVTAMFMLDNTYSMAQTNGVTSRFDRAKAALEQAIDALPSDSSAAVLLASDVSEPLIVEPTYDLALVHKVIHDAHLSDRATELAAPLGDAVGILKKNPAGRKELYLATDGQALGFTQMDEIAKILDQNKEQIHAHILLTGEPETHNLSVSDLRLSSDIPAVGALLPFDVEVTNWGTDDVQNVQVTLAVDDQTAADATIDDIAPGQSRTIVLQARVRDAGYHTVTASVPADPLPADDSRTIAFRAVSKVRVLLVDGSPGAQPRDSEVFYLRHALIPVPRAQADDYVVQCTTIAPVDLPAQHLEDYQAVVLADVTDAADRTLNDLSTYVNRGGGLLIFPGDDLRADFYNTRMLPSLLPAPLGDKQQTASTRPSDAYRLSARPLDHPIVSIFAKPDSGDVAAAHFTARLDLKPTDQSRTILNFSDGKPFMLERPVGLGRVILFASTASTKWNDLPDHAGIWVPLLYRTLGWIVLQSQQALNIGVGDRLVYQADAQDVGRQAAILTPGGGKDSRQVELDESNHALVAFEQTDRAGEYDITIGDQPPVRFAAQADKNESNLQEITPAQKSRLALLADVVDYREGLNLKENLYTQRVGREFWLPLAAMALVLAIAETLLADRFTRPK